MARALAPGVTTAALSLPRGNGKSTLVAWLARRALTPGDPLFVAGAESHVAAASIGQARRTTFRILRLMVESDGGGAYRIAESVNNCHVTHRETGTRVSVIASSGKTSQGLVHTPFVFADEPGAWEVAGGALMHDALQTAQGKPGSPLRVVYLGTLAPATSGWWHDLVEGGSTGTTHVTALQADPAKWDRASEIKRVNPLMWAFAASRAKLLEERDEARTDTRKRAAFLSYRLNVPTRDESTVLLTVPEWGLVTGRPVGGRFGRPVVGLDLGGGRAWSAAVALWRSGRLEAVAVAPGIPDIAAQERRDRVPSGTYAKLVESGRLKVASGRRVPDVEDLAALVRAWRPEVCVCDRFRLPELQDAAAGRLRLVPRVARYSEQTEDIRALRRIALDGPLSCTQESRALVAASLSAAAVAHDDAGNVKLVKRGTNNQARDDVAAALVLAAGALARAPRAARPPRLHVIGGAA